MVPVATASPLFSTSLWEVPVPWTGVGGHGTVCQGSYPTTLTPRTVDSLPHPKQERGYGVTLCMR